MKITRRRLQIIAFTMSVSLIAYFAVKDPSASGAIIMGAFTLMGSILANFAGTGVSP